MLGTPLSNGHIKQGCSRQEITCQGNLDHTHTLKTRPVNYLSYEPCPHVGTTPTSTLLVQYTVTFWWKEAIVVFCTSLYLSSCFNDLLISAQSVWHIYIHVYIKCNRSKKRADQTWKGCNLMRCYIANSYNINSGEAWIHIFLRTRRYSTSKFVKHFSSSFSTLHKFMQAWHQWEVFRSLLVAVQDQQVVEWILWHCRPKVCLDSPQCWCAPLTHSIGGWHYQDQLQQCANFGNIATAHQRQWLEVAPDGGNRNIGCLSLGSNCVFKLTALKSLP